MVNLGRGPKPTHRAREVDAADLLGPKIVFGHVGKAAERPQPAGNSDFPACFFKDFAVKRGYRLLATVNAAARQLELWYRLGLVGCKDVVALQKHRINPRSASVTLARLYRLAIASDHVAPLDLRLP
jgi:hypothetical protein